MPPPHLFPLHPTIASAPRHMMSARRNPISEIISWMMHKMEKRIYFGVDTTNCCCKHRNGKMRRLRRWKCIMKPGRRWRMLSNLKPREREREARTAAYGAKKKKKIPSIFSTKERWICVEVLGERRDDDALCSHLNLPTCTARRRSFAPPPPFSAGAHRGKTGVPVSHVNNEFLIWAPHEILISGILAHQGEIQNQIRGSWLSGWSARRPI